jgi:hypothetical protein
MTVEDGNPKKRLEIGKRRKAGDKPLGNTINKVTPTPPLTNIKC